MNNHIRNIHVLNICVRSPGDVGKPEEFFDGGGYDHNQVSRMVGCLLDDLFAFKKIVRHQLTRVVLKVSHYI